MRRGIAYVYLALLVATAVAIGLLAAIMMYQSMPSNTRLPGELADREVNITSMKLIAHYCAARASMDSSVTQWPSPGYSYNLTDEYNLFARSSGRPQARDVECYNMTKTDKTVSETTSIGAVVSFTVKPQHIGLTERFGTIYLKTSFNTSIMPVVLVNYSLGVADFRVKIYYRALLSAEEQKSGIALLNESLSIQMATSTLHANGTSRSYPVDISHSDIPGYDWVISTSFVLDPTGPTSYVIEIDLYLFDGVKQVIEVEVSW